jgi:gamma-glutamyltranspeptidase/glutathione hydrolase
VYYRGWIAEEFVRSFRAIGGLISRDDLAEHRSDWVEPLSITYRGTTIYELPPNSQGMVALMMLNILQHLPEEPMAEGGEEYVHLLAEVARLAYADRENYVTDPDHMRIAPQELLSDDYARQRAELIQDRAADRVMAGTPGGTIYLCTADGEGNLVSLIESNFMGIGSGVMAGETGIMLQNRGAWFSLDPDHCNVIGPRKRTMHTLMPGMAFRDGNPWLVFGTMGGSMQSQIHVELLTRLIDQGMQVDEAVDAPRFDAVIGEDGQGRPALVMEGRFPPEVVDALRERGQGVQVVEPYTSMMGHSHAIELIGDGVYVGASDPRSEGLALGY